MGSQVWENKGGAESYLGITTSKGGTIGDERKYGRQEHEKSQPKKNNTGAEKRAKAKTVTYKKSREDKLGTNGWKKKKKKWENKACNTGKRGNFLRKRWIGEKAQGSGTGGKNVLSSWMGKEDRSVGRKTCPEKNTTVGHVHEWKRGTKALKRVTRNRLGMGTETVGGGGNVA